MSLLTGTLAKTEPRRWRQTYAAPSPIGRFDADWYADQRRVIEQGVVALGWVLSAPSAVWEGGVEDDFGTVVVADARLEEHPDVVWGIAEGLRSLPPTGAAPVLAHVVEMISLRRGAAPRYRAPVPRGQTSGYSCEVARVLFQRSDRDYHPLAAGPLPLFVFGDAPVVVVPRVLWGDDIARAYRAFGA